jgi:hypothetical protein
MRLVNCDYIFFREQGRNHFFPKDDNLESFLFQDRNHKKSREFLMLV